jgi:FkbM family methyltransferase
MKLCTPLGGGITTGVQNSEGRPVIDVGANVGKYTDVFLREGASSVIAIEPGPVLASKLRTKYADEPRVIVRQEGLSNAPGMLYGVKFHNCWTLARPGEFGDRLSWTSPGAEEHEGTGVFDVALTTLDEVVRREQVTDLAFVKIDVDGYEDRLLRGAEHVLTVLRPAMMIELSYLIQELGDDVREFVRNIYAHDYILTSMAGEPATEDDVMAQFPWHTSFDVMMVPVDRQHG